MLVVPESVNPGWVAHTPDGAALTPVIVNGWQQGWVVPAGEQGAITLTFPPTPPTAPGWPSGCHCCRCCCSSPWSAARAAAGPHPAQPWAVPCWQRRGAGRGAVIAGIGGMLVFGGWLAATSPCVTGSACVTG